MATGVAGNGQSVALQADSPSSMPVSWEGEKMFNIYIYDYCQKRGFRKTARELLSEADITADATPPINAKQGLLFEWWSVFWVLFTAKSNGAGTDDAMLYTQHQAQQAQQRQAQTRLLPQQQQMSRFMNGMQRQPGLVPNGQLPNGVGQNSLTGAPGTMPAGSNSFSISASGPQPNGILGPSGPPSAPGTSSSQSPNFPQMPGQRPNGPQQRGSNGMPFQSPTLSHTQNPGGAPGPQQQAPMGQLGPSPHLQMNRGGMLPPNGPQGMNSSGMMGPQTSATSFPPRPASRTASPSQNSVMTHPSPSFVARQPGMASGPNPMITSLENDFRQIPTPALTSLKQEAGLADKDVSSLTLDDKQHIVHLARQRSSRVKPPANATAGPSTQPPNQGNPQGRQPSQRLKRNSTSPAGDLESLPRTDNSPPDRKRPRRSPLGMEQQQQQPQQQQPPMTPLSYPHPPPQQGGPQQVSNGMMRGMGGPPMNGFSQPQGMQNMGGNPGMNMHIGQPIGPPQMTNAMSPGMSPHPAGMMPTQHMAQIQQFNTREAQHRQSHQKEQLKNLPPGASIPGGGGGMPTTSDPSFNANGAQGQFTSTSSNRMSNKMLPPSSSANGPPKDHPGSKDNKSGILHPPNGHPEGSPRNPPNMGQGQGGSNSGNASQGSNAPTTPAPGPALNMTAPSPSSILGNPSTPMNPVVPDPMQPNLFSTDFIQSVASTLDDFDPSIFRQDGDINFERDFGQWFADDVSASLDLK